jgi:hypothetical protein
MDPELDCRCRPPGRCCIAPLPPEDAELRRTMRFVTVSPTGVGVVTWVRSAAAAAALDRLGLDSRSRTNALVAASEADALGGARWGCIAGLLAWRRSKPPIPVKTPERSRAEASCTYRIRGSPSAFAEHGGLYYSRSD